MKQLQKSDLKVSEIYKLKAHNREYLYRISDMRTSMTLCNDGYLIIDTNRFIKISNISQSHDFADAKYIETKEKYEFYNATPEEKHWLETCIKADQFVPYEEAMKTFIPEYVECIKEEKPYNFYGDLGKIYKVDNWNHSHYDCMLIETTSGSTCKNRFKPSTKEAYDAQFVVKDEFVLPEKWCIKTSNMDEIVKAWFLSKNDSFVFGHYYYGNCPLDKRADLNHYGGLGMNFIPNHPNIEITLDQFKKYVLKENTIVTEEPKVVLEEPKDKVLKLSSNYGKESIVKVECSEGGVYRIGDKITVFDKYSPNKGKPFIIKSFRWSNDKSKICAVTELHTPNGIGLDKIELYVESKVKVKDDFVLPENWYIKVTDDNKEVLQQYIRNIHDSIMITLSNINYVAYSKWLNGINQTENKLGYGLISNLNLNPLPNIYRTVTYYNGVEITFEQFKKYVLKDE